MHIPFPATAAATPCADTVPVLALPLQVAPGQTAGGAPATQGTPLPPLLPLSPPSPPLDPQAPCCRRPDGKATVRISRSLDSHGDSMMEAIVARQHQRSLSFSIANHSSPSQNRPLPQAFSWPPPPSQSSCSFAWTPAARIPRPAEAHQHAAAPAPVPATTTRPPGRRPRQLPAAVPIPIPAPSSASTISTTSPSSASFNSSTSPTSSASTSSREISPRSKPKMPGRPVKRSAGSGDEDSPGHGSGNKVKLPRLDRGPDDFSSVVKNRLQSYTRTGQACDRCKVRKIRCDALPEGCSHCTNQNLECYVTDRVTGRTERRGYLQELERQKSDMMSHIRDLEKLLGEKGVEVQPWHWSPYVECPPGVTFDSMGNPVQDPQSSDSWSQFGTVWVKNDDGSTDTKPSSAPTYRRTLLESRRGDAHVGTSGDDSAPLSSIKGTQLSILGTTVDLASFEAPDMDEPPQDAKPLTPLYNKSTTAFLQSTMHINPPLPAELPSREDAFTYSEWYFMTIASFLPVLHKPSFTQLLTRVYDEPSFVPSVAESVMIHMVFATIYFQYGVRNWQKADQRAHLNNLSNKHYHYALSKFFDLTSSPDLAAVQAMAMISAHTRAFPKSGSSSIVVNHALHRALELNLHRESRKPGEATNLNHELRKRAWWVILTVYVAINGRRGLPMPITVEEFDVGFPEPIADELLTEDGVDTSRTLPCLYEPGVCAFKIVPIMMEMYSNIYCVRRDPNNYLNIVNALEAQVKAWDDELPGHLKLGHQDQTEHSHMGAVYMRSFLLEIRLCLRHPSVTMTTDSRIVAENTRICEEVSREMLQCQLEIQRFKCLDTTWYQLSIHAACIFTMLVAHWERRFETTPEAVAQLRQDMNGWVGILEETGSLLGSGPQIGAEIKQIIDRTIAWIEHDMRNNDPKSSQPPPPTSVPAEVKQEQSAQPSSYRISEVPAAPAPTAAVPPPPPAVSVSAPVTSAPAQATPNGTAQADVSAKQFYQGPSMNGQTSYQTLGYGEQPQNNMAQPSYDAEAALFFNTSAQAAAAAAAVTTVQGVSASHTNPLIAFASQATQHMPTQATADMMWQNRGSTWHDWTAAIADTQDRYSATALLTLGGGPRDTSAPSMAEAAPGLTTNDMNGVHMQSWPLTLFDNVQQNGS